MTGVILLSILAIILAPIGLLFVIVVFASFTVMVIVMDSFNLSFEEPKEYNPYPLNVGRDHYFMAEGHNGLTWKMTGIAMYVGDFTLRGLVLVLALPLLLLVVLAVIIFFFPFTITLLISYCLSLRDPNSG